MRAFASFELDDLEKALWRRTEREWRRVALRPKAFDLLCYLCRHPYRLIGQGELLDALWPGVHVQPEVLKSQILLVRKALGDDTPPYRFIQTERGRGYRFIAPARAPRARQPAPPKPLYGRSAQLAALASALEDARDGGVRTIFLAAERGMGKTALIEAFLQGPSKGADVHVLRGACPPVVGGLEPFFPLRDGLNAILAGALGESGLMILRRRAPTWFAHLHGAAAPDVRDLAPTLARECRDLVEALSEIRPLVLVLDDLQWSDASTLDVVAALAGRPSGRALVLASYRTGGLTSAPVSGLHQELARHGLAEALPLPPLSHGHVAEWLRDRSDAQPRAAIVETVLERTGGRPACVEMAVRSLEDLRPAIVSEHATPKAVGL